MRIKFWNHVFPLFIVHCSLFICNCGLTNPLPEGDLQEKIDENVKWANAAQLTVTVAIPSGWGTSPHLGTNICRDNVRTTETPRQGYPFTVEFTPLPGFGFEQWLAFRTDDYEGLDKTKSATDQAIKSLALNVNGSGATITEGVSQTGARTATVTINISDPVTLVPWCSSHLTLTRSNPPLTFTPTDSFPYDQKVSLWFNLAVKPDTVIVGDTIRISAVNAATGMPFVKAEHNITDGDISQYFEASFPSLLEPEWLQLSVKKVEEGYSAADLSLLQISVEVGTGVQSTAGLAMASSQTVRYRTSSSEAQKVYEAFNIQAQRRNDEAWFGDGGWNNPNVDRRFNQTDRNTVTIKFTVTNPEGVAALPNRFTVTELLSHSLNGGPPAIQDPPPKNTGTLANPIGGFYSIAYTLQTSDPGIIQLVICPWYEGTDGIEAQNYNAALSAGHFVTVVLDTAAPDLSSLNINLSPHAYFESGTDVYVYRPEKPLSVTVGGLGNLIDNGSQNGIPPSLAWNQPWTMGDISKLFWYVRIGEESSGKKATSGRLTVYDGPALNNTSPLLNIDELTDDAGYRVYVQFEDDMGNVSGWKDTGFKVKFSNAQIYSVTYLKAKTNAAGDEVTVSWEYDNAYQSAELIIRAYRASASGDVFERNVLEENGNPTINSGRGKYNKHS